VSPVVSLYVSSNLRSGDWGSAPESIVDHWERKLNVLREAVDTDALNDSIDLMPPSGALAFLVVVHDAVFHLHY
jgi:hypothetical protein